MSDRTDTGERHYRADELRAAWHYIDSLEEATVELPDSLPHLRGDDVVKGRLGIFSRVVAKYVVAKALAVYVSYLLEVA
jgi:hypothetical protein